VWHHSKLNKLAGGGVIKNYNPLGCGRFFSPPELISAEGATAGGTKPDFGRTRASSIVW